MASKCPIISAAEGVAPLVSRGLLFILLIFLANASFAAPPASLSPDDKKAYREIAAARRFCDEAVGYAGETPKVVLAFRELFNSPHADAAFKQLLADATTAGKLYALCGIYYTDPEYFEKVVQPFRHSSEQVETFVGCLVEREEVGSIVESGDNNVVRLKNRFQTIEQWMAEMKLQSMNLDIIGGGWPDTFKESGGNKR